MSSTDQLPRSMSPKEYYARLRGTVYEPQRPSLKKPFDSILHPKTVPLPIIHPNYSHPRTGLRLSESALSNSMDAVKRRVFRRITSGELCDLVVDSQGIARTKKE